MLRRSLMLVLAALLVASLVPAALASTPAEPFALDLAGTWRFTVGDDPSWAEPEYDDSGWEEVHAPASFGEIGHGDHSRDYAWYRRTVDLPEDAAGTPLLLALGPVDDVDETYLNGTLIGATGSFPPAYDSVWEYPRIYPIPPEAVRWGGTNTIAIRIYNGGPAGWDGGGGLFLGPLGLNSRAHQRVADLGIATTPASPAQTELATSTLAEQATAIAAGDLDAYADTLGEGFLHDGHTAARRLAVLGEWLTRGDGLALTDADVEVAVAPDGTLIADVVRTWTAHNGADLGRLAQTRWEPLHLDPADGREVGNRSRYFEDGLWSEVDDRWWDYQVWLPPQYLDEPTRRFPTVYLLHGANGGPREWEWRVAMPYDRIDHRYERMFATDGYEPTIVVSVDAGSGNFDDGDDSAWSTVFATELVPNVDDALRTVADRSGRGLTGFSMGGAGVYINGFRHDELFGSLASHAAFAPTSGMNTMAMQTPEWLARFAYYMDSGADDAFRGGEFVRLMSAELTAKLVEHEARVVPGGHDPEYLAPALDGSFCSHSRFFRQEPFEDCAEVPGPSPAAEETDPAPTAEPQPQPGSLPATGGGLALAAAAVLGALAVGRRY